MSHTEGKLLVLDTREVGGDCISISNGSVVIARIKNEVTGRPINDEDLANARRLVACWNALEPYPTELIEKDADFINSHRSLLYDQINRLTKERDELLKALRSVYAWSDVLHSGVCSDVEEILSRYQEEE